MFIDVVENLGKTRLPNELRVKIKKSLQEINPLTRVGLVEDALASTITHLSNTATTLETRVDNLDTQLQTVATAVNVTLAPKQSRQGPQFTRNNVRSSGGKHSKKSRKARSKKHRKTRRRSA